MFNELNYEYIVSEASTTTLVYVQLSKTHFKHLTPSTESTGLLTCNKESLPPWFPQSPIVKPPVKRKFSGFKSRWSIPLWWQCSVALSICSMNFATWPKLEQWAYLYMILNDFKRHESRIWMNMANWSHFICTAIGFSFPQNNTSSFGVVLSVSFVVSTHNSLWGSTKNLRVFGLLQTQEDLHWLPQACRY